MKRNLRNISNACKKVYTHVKNNAGVYVILAAVAYVIYQVLKMVLDTGIKDGEPYFKEFEEPDSEMEV